jgi:hypothetical protein
MTCQGNSSEFCGGPSRLNVYNYTGTDLPANSAGGGGGGGGTAIGVFPVLSGLPTGWAYNSCWVYVICLLRFTYKSHSRYTGIMLMVVFWTRKQQEGLRIRSSLVSHLARPSTLPLLPPNFLVSVSESFEALEKGLH